ncbi:ankyrin repeat domain-containing protein, chloroplastic isoform X2 [Actinidia eriantha]|uniref:ankyrin repeat domain-containing protein, chloroplastic isoform X2 n=1 Tax=Actinidia eriantha TaxID=165200 RepID=UPI00258ED1FE|nr:ankyrin repeat domain-containing protein, chloroplastic isoform X2 [Actinidia eriantha]
MTRTMSPPPSLLKNPTPKLFSLLSASPLSLSTPRGLSPSRTLTLPRKSSSSLSSSFNFSPQYQHRQQEFNGDEEEDEELVIGDCVVFEDGAFEDPYLHQTFDSDLDLPKTKSKSAVEVKPEDLVPEKWKEVQAEINITKKERRRIAREMEFGSRVEKRKQGLVPIRNARVEDYVAYRDEKLKQLNPVGVDNPRFLEEKHEKDVKEVSRVTPRNPRLAVYGGTLDDISAFFSSGNYDPNAAQNPEGHRKLFSKEEKVLLNRRIPELSAATSGKWLPLHSLVASGEFYLVNALLKHDVDINIRDKDGQTALHKAIVSKKQAIFNYLLRESANPFVRDNEGATLMHHAVRTASSQMIKILLLYNVDINLQDNDGWTPLHLAVQTRRTDIVRLLLIKGADKTLKNQDGLTPLDLCLYCGQDTRTYELIKLMKQPPKPRKSFNYSLKCHGWIIGLL